jgi:hypothetical protein
MMNAFTKSTNAKLDEIAIADLGDFQVAILTSSKPAKKKGPFPFTLRSKRVYQDQGWLICHGESIAHLSGLEIGPVDSVPSPWMLPKRLAPSIPISFETQSCQPLPRQVSRRSVFTCVFPEARLPHQGVFRSITPRFVRIYPFDVLTSLVEVVAHMQAEEAEFIAENREQLKQIPFYRLQFNL